VHKGSFERFGALIESAKNDGHKLILAGKTDGRKGFFVEPAIFEVAVDADGTVKGDMMTRELFGPLIAVQAYDDSVENPWEDICDIASWTNEV
jgi:1-pyrroline-5-carboxylate dehydrogenase